MSAEMNPDPVLGALDALGLPYEVMECDPDLADTAVFCDAYGIDPEDSANTIVVVGKSDPPSYALTVVLATTRLDVNRVVRKRLGVRKASFASADETLALTGMQIGGVTPFGTTTAMPIWIDSSVMTRARVVIGGGGRDRKILLAPAVLAAHPDAEVVEDLAVAR